MPEAQRRFTTIEAADVAGYSRLLAQNEEAAVEALRALRRIDRAEDIRIHGRIANTAGVSLLIEYPSVVDAVRCVLDVQDEIAARLNTMNEIGLIVPPALMIQETEFIE